MFELREFKPKYFIGWLAIALPLAIIFTSQSPTDKLAIFFGAFPIVFVYGLFGLGIQYLIAKFQNKPLLQREFIWWGYPIFVVILIGMAFIFISLGIGKKS